MKEGRKPEYRKKNPGNELQKMPHTKPRRFKPQARLEPAQQHWWQARKPEAGIMEADKTTKWRQFSQSNRHSTISTRQTQYHEALPSSVNVQPHLTSSFADDSNASWYSVCRVTVVDDGWTVKTVVTWRSSASMIPAPDVLTVTPRVTIILNTRQIPCLAQQSVKRSLFSSQRKHTMHDYYHQKKTHLHASHHARCIAGPKDCSRVNGICTLGS